MSAAFLKSAEKIRKKEDGKIDRKDGNPDFSIANDIFFFLILAKEISGKIDKGCSKANQSDNQDHHLNPKTQVPFEPIYEEKQTTHQGEWNHCNFKKFPERLRFEKRMDIFE